MSKSRSYRGPDRRRHQMFVTKNTEYHFRDGVCVAVRERDTGRWKAAHTALNRNISGAVRFDRRGEAYPTVKHPEVGDAMFFAAGGPDVVTSCLTVIERPARDVVEAYPS